MRKGYTTPQPKQRPLLLHGCALYKVEKAPTLSTLQQQRWPICKKADGIVMVAKCGKYVRCLVTLPSGLALPRAPRVTPITLDVLQ